MVTGETGPGLSYIRYAAGPQGVHGFLFGYEGTLAPEIDRLVIAVANAFEPFPVPAGAAQAAQNPDGAGADSAVSDRSASEQRPAIPRRRLQQVSRRPISGCRSARWRRAAC